jgi:hypothetical protein
MARDQIATTGNMDRIRYFANVSVRRAVTFPALGILTVFMGLSWNWVLDLGVTAILLSLLAASLVVCAWRADRKHYQDREVWLLLDQWHGLPEPHAHHTISHIMRETFLRYAERGAWAAVLLWLATFTGTLLAALDAHAH